MTQVAVVYSCCAVATWGWLDTPCWICGERTGRDAWKNTWPEDNDGLIARRAITLSDKKVSPI